ncbi:hypothetical protein P8825_14745 [Shouchella clausii]|uniref:hypothetical protein n=1 Tax=Shouchella clausii TaxID=79880 RepID=UPI002DB8CFF8|nr:hypothetical protein [Shouchella clausii]MEB5480821.1 hypothetical protein [Shouchella clausii]
MIAISFSSLAWLAVKTSAVIGSSTLIISGLNYHHNYKTREKGSARLVNSRKSAKQRLEELQKLASEE